MRRIEEGLLMLTCALGQPVQPLTESELQYMEKLVTKRPRVQSEVEVNEHFFRSLGYDARQAARFVGLLERDEVLRNYLSVPDVQVLTRLSSDYPERLRLLRAHMPTALFCKGNISLFSTPCISLVGSRAICARNRAFAERIGTLAAQEGFTLVSGGAVGADSAAQEACLRAGGKVICFVPNELSCYRKTANILYCSDEGWNLKFSAARALRRNHYIHALGEKTFVASCPQPKGGTWSGTSYNLNHRLSEVYILDDNSDGMRLLRSMGAVAVDDRLSSISDLLPQKLSIFD